MQKNEYIKVAEKIPSIGHGGITIKKHLIEYAACAKNAIIEVGSFLGSATAFLAIGSLFGNRAAVHACDLWEAIPHYIAQMKRNFNIDFQENEDLFPYFAKYTKPFSEVIVPHRMNVLDMKWGDEKIDILVLDMGCGKKHTMPAFDVLTPYFVQGETILFLMDYYFYEIKKDPVYRYQFDLMTNNKKTWEFVQRPPDSYTAIFRYNGGKTKEVDGESAVLSTHIGQFDANR